MFLSLCIHTKLLYVQANWNFLIKCMLCRRVIFFADKKDEFFNQLEAIRAIWNGSMYDLKKINIWKKTSTTSLAILSQYSHFGLLNIFICINTWPHATSKYPANFIPKFGFIRPTLKHIVYSQYILFQIIFKHKQSNQSSILLANGGKSQILL